MSRRQSSYSASENWYTASDAIKHLREGLVLFVDETVKRQHSQMMSKIGSQRCNRCQFTTLLPNHAYEQNHQSPDDTCQFSQKECPCLEKKYYYRRKCPRNVCGQIYDKILTLYRFYPPTPCWRNTNISKWSEDPWEYAKCFISFPGYSDKVGPDDIDCTGLLHIIINNKAFHQHLDHQVSGKDIYCRVRSQIEGIYRNPSHEVSQKALHEFLRDVKAVLLDKKTLCKREECQIAAKNIEQLVTSDCERIERETSEDEDFEFVEENAFISRYGDEFIHEAQIGEGGYGVVFRATKKNENHPYAVKRIGLPERPERNGQVTGEVEALKQLDHQNIVRYFSSWIENPPDGWQKKWDVKNKISEMSRSHSPSSGRGSTTSEFSHSPSSGSGSTPGDSGPKSYLYIQMQLCRTTLRAWLDDDLERERKNVLKCFEQVSSAVCYLHEKDLIHRDLNPSNIFFTDDNTVKVGDFGLATALSKDDEVLFYTDAGTPFYRSPESVKTRGKVRSVKVDIYSMGVILFELLRPFRTGSERIKVLEALREYTFPDEFSETMPQEKELVARLMAENPNERPTANELLLLLPDLQYH